MKAGFGYVIGRRHAAETDPEMHICQDLAAAYTDDEISVIAVADGKAGRPRAEQDGQQHGADGVTSRAAGKRQIEHHAKE